jgi:hypothetical protein
MKGPAKGFHLIEYYELAMMGVVKRRTVVFAENSNFTPQRCIFPTRTIAAGFYQIWATGWSLRLTGHCEPALVGVPIIVEKLLKVNDLAPVLPRDALGFDIDAQVGFWINTSTHAKPSASVPRGEIRDIRALGRRAGLVVFPQYFNLLIFYKQPEFRFPK